MYKDGATARSSIVTISTCNSFLQHNHQYITSQVNQKLSIMHFTVPALLAVLSATAAVAAPTDSDYKPYYNKDKYNKDCADDWKSKWESNEWKKSEKLFYFDKEYYVKASPDEVIATTGIATPGQPGAKGIFKYGINVAENTICYVSSRLFPHFTTSRTNQQPEHHPFRCHR
jgi:hypothetical protein